jgi:hypothetical protein
MWESSIFHEINPSSPPIKGGSLLLIWSSNTREHNMTRREEPHSYLSSLASSSVGREWVRVKKYRSCLLHPLVYSGPLVHLAEGMLGIIGSSPLVPLRTEYYLELRFIFIFGGEFYFKLVLFII